MKPWLGILLIVALVCAQAVAAINPGLLPEHERACQCCGCGGMDCCVVPVAPAPAPPTPAAFSITIQKTVAANPVVTIAWIVPETAPRQNSFSPPVVHPFTDSLHQRLCVLVI